MEKQTVNNILKFACPRWDPVERITRISQLGISSQEAQDFFAHCDKCSFCRQTAVATLEKEKKSFEIQRHNPKRKIFALLATVLIALSTQPAYFNPKIKQLSENTITKQNISKAKNLYEELDLTIDKYLSTSDTNYLEQANQTAQTIYIKHGDKWGIDLVSYYKKCSIKDHADLLNLRKEFSQLKAKNFRDDYANNLKQTLELVEQFLLLGDPQEAYRTKTLLSRLYSLNFGAPENITQEGLNYANKNKFKLLEAYFLLWESKSFLRKIPLEEQMARLERSINLGRELNLTDIVVSAGMSLAGLYERNERNKEALSLCKELKELINSSLNTSLHKTMISILQIEGMASFKLGDKKSESYLQDAVQLCKEKKEFFHLALTYALIANNNTQDGLYQEAQMYLDYAEKETLKVSDEKAYLDISSTVLAYKGKLYLAAREYTKSATFYRSALSRLETLGLEGRSLEMEQLNEGLFLALQAQGDPKAEDSQVLAIYYRNKAKAETQNFSCLLSFTPSRCN